MSASTQLVVIGAGPGGYASAFYAADRGMKVALVVPSPNPGGVCLYRGCIPSKALLHVAKVVNEAKHASAWGVTFGAPSIERPGTVVGLDPVAITACPNVSVLVVPSAFVTSSERASRKAAVPWM